MRPPEDKAGDGQDEVPGTGTGGGTAGPGQRGDIGERYRARKREFLDVGLSCLPTVLSSGGLIAVLTCRQCRGRISAGSFAPRSYGIRQCP